MRTTDHSTGRNYICPMCGKPIDLNKDETADEDGRVMHAACYLRRVAGEGSDPPSPSHAN